MKSNKSRPLAKLKLITLLPPHTPALLCCTALFHQEKGRKMSLYNNSLYFIGQEGASSPKGQNVHYYSLTHVYNHGNNINYGDNDYCD